MAENRFFMHEVKVCWLLLFPHSSVARILTLTLRFLHVLLQGLLLQFVAYFSHLLDHILGVVVVVPVVRGPSFDVIEPRGGGRNLNKRTEILKYLIKVMALSVSNNFVISFIASSLFFFFGLFFFFRFWVFSLSFLEGGGGIM